MSDVPVQSRTLSAMAMDFILTVVGDVPGESVDSVSRHLEADLRWADGVFSTYREDSWISRIGHGSAAVADAPPAVAEVLDLCERMREETGGHFDARSPHGAIDPTGVVKTWAMERSVWRLGLLGADGWSLACAGDIRAHGQAPTAAGWRIGIADPRVEPGPDARTVGRVTLTSKRGGFSAVATSGSAQSGTIWSPRKVTGSPVLQATVLGTDLVQCDAWATAVVAGGTDVARRAPSAGCEVKALRLAGDRLKAFSTPGWPK